MYHDLKWGKGFQLGRSQVDLVDFLQDRTTHKVPYTYALTVSQLGALCKAVQRVCSYVIPRIESFTLKYELAGLIYYSTQAASSAVYILSHRMGCRIDTSLCYLSPNWDTLIVQLQQNSDLDQLWGDLFGLLYAATHDAKVQLLTSRFPDLQEIIATVEQHILPVISRLATEKIEKTEILTCWQPQQDTVVKPLPNFLSVPPPATPGRPAFFHVSDTNDVPEKDPIEGVEMAAKLTHMSLVCLETVSLEMTASYFAQFPEIDWNTQLLLARHNFDESRHCQMLWELLRTLGRSIYSYQNIDIRTWVVNQRYKDLSEKVAVSHRLLESYGVEACMLVAIKLRVLGLDEAAMIYDVQQVDEIGHVRSADAILRHLQGDNYETFMRKTFNEFIQEVPKLGLPIDKLIRMADGFSQEEISRFQTWS